jgi:heme-degrading monooxygenase HmoA
MDTGVTITRIWHGRTSASRSDDYLQYIRDTGLKDYLNTPGLLTAKILRRVEGDICHFWTVTEWPDVESIKKFAGADFEKARYYPEDRKFLLELEEKVIHCETYIK